MNGTHVMRFGINGLDLLANERKTGVSSYIYNLIASLAQLKKTEHQIIVYVRKDFHDLDWIIEYGLSLKRIGIPSRPRGLQFVARVLTEHFVLAFLAQQDSLDLIHFPNHVLPIFWPVKILRTLTIHDITVFTHPQTHSLRTRFYFRKFIPPSLVQADWIICDSQNTAADIEAQFNLTSDKISVIQLGVSERYRLTDQETISATLAHFGLSYRDYLLFLGNLEPRKNIDGLIRAYGQLTSQGLLSEKLVIAGKRTRFYEGIFNLVAQLKLEDQIIFTDYVSDEMAVDLYNGATCFVFASHYEGFGLPVLEAMSCGVPVITSNVASLPEIAGDAALLVNPADDNQLMAAIKNVVSDPLLRADMRKKSLRQAQLFTWTHCAEETLQIWKQLTQIS